MSKWLSWVPVFLFFALGVQGQVLCDKTGKDGYSYCVHIPEGENLKAKMPVVLFLSGSGARDDGSESNRASYDGFGRLVLGNLTTSAARVAKRDFITIIPISPKFKKNGSIIRHWQVKPIEQVIEAVRLLVPQADFNNQLHCVGYSMGARGCWRYSVARSGRLASSVMVAGSAESLGDTTLIEEVAAPTFPLLINILSLPIYAVTGGLDETAPLKKAQTVQGTIKKLGGTVSVLRVASAANHEYLALEPFNVAMMDWMKGQRKRKPTSTILRRAHHSSHQ